MVIRKILLPLLLISFTSCSDVSDDVVTISVAASLMDAIIEIRDSYPADDMLHSRINFVSSSTGARQIDSGQDVSIFISANEEWVDFLRGKYIDGTKKSLLSNRIVIALHRDSHLSISHPEDLTGLDITRIAMGDPSHVPAGIYGKQAFEHLGLWTGIESKVVGAMDVRAAMALLTNKAVDCAIVYRSDLLMDDSLKLVYQFPENEQKPIEYYICRFDNDSKSQKIYDYLFTEEAQNIFARYGFSRGAGL